MSLILKGIDLPDEKLMEIFESDNHIYIGGHYYPLMIKDVVQIPKGHGRLIDGDELKEKYSNWLEAVPFVNNSLADMGRRDVLISVNHDLTYSAPTILEAEEDL